MVKAAALGAAALLAAGYGGSLHPAGDSLSVARPVLAAAVLLCALSARGWRTGRVLAAGAVLSLAAFAWTRVPVGSAPGEVVLYQKNMLFGGSVGEAFIADVRASGADVVTLQEVSRANLARLAPLEDAYPHRLDCMGVALLSRWPLEQTACDGRGGLAMAVVDRGGQRFRVASIHLSWPWPWPQQPMVRRMVERHLAGTGDLPLVIAGDFNMVPEGTILHWMARGTGTRRIGHAPRTYSVLGYPLAIDHVLATGGRGAVETRPRLGSDHFGLLARIDLPGAAEQAIALGTGR